MKPDKLTLKIPLLVVISVLMLVYPFLVYRGLSRWSPSLLIGVLFIVVALRFIFSGGFRQKSQIFGFVFIAVYSLTVYLTNSELLLRFYPAAISIFVSYLFFSSLMQPESFLEKWVKKTGKVITPNIKHYLFYLSGIWGVLMLINSAVAAWTACCSNIKTWAWYNGFFVYFLFAAVFLMEWLYRQYYIRKYGD